MFLDEIRCAGSLADIEKVFSYLKLEEDIIAVFLCSKLALSNAHIVRPLIKYTRHVETGNGLDLIYSQHPEKGFKHIKHKIAGNIETGIKFEKLKGEDLLRLPEGQISWEENGHSTQEDSNMAGIPIANDRLSEAQQLLLSKIERVTAAQVILRQDIFNSNAFDGFLSQPEDAPDEDDLCDMPSPPLRPSPEEYGELCYVADISPKDNWSEYPDSVQCELKTLIADQEPYNWLYFAEVETSAVP